MKTQVTLIVLVTMILVNPVSALPQTSAPPEDIEPEEYAVYSALIPFILERARRRFPSPIALIVINDHTTAIGEPHYLSGMGLTETYESFKVKNRRAYPLDRRFELKVRYVLAERAEGMHLSPREFNARYQGGYGTLILSRAGLNGEKTEALVFVREQRGGDARASGYTLAKEGGEWKVKRTRFLWVT